VSGFNFTSGKSSKQSATSVSISAGALAILAALAWFLVAAGSTAVTLVVVCFIIIAVGVTIGLIALLWMVGKGIREGAQRSIGNIGQHRSYGELDAPHGRSIGAGHRGGQVERLSDYERGRLAVYDEMAAEWKRQGGGR
jgi:hypothetical protein